MLLDLCHFIHFKLLKYYYLKTMCTFRSAIYCISFCYVFYILIVLIKELSNQCITCVKWNLNCNTKLFIKLKIMFNVSYPRGMHFLLILQVNCPGRQVVSGQSGGSSLPSRQSGEKSHFHLLGMHLVLQTNWHFYIWLHSRSISSRFSQLCLENIQLTNLPKSKMNWIFRMPCLS